jgi:hypothetical protein
MAGKLLGKSPGNCGKIWETEECRETVKGIARRLRSGETKVASRFLFHCGKENIRVRICVLLVDFKLETSGA